MALKGNDLVITNNAGESHGYVLCLDRQYGDPIAHTKAAPNVGMSNAATPAQAGGPYDVRDYDGDKAISHIDWTLGAGQVSLDADGATPFMFRDSSCIDISRPGELRLSRAVVDTPLAGTVGPMFSALGYLWKGNSLGALSYSSDEGATWVACDGYTSTAPISGWTTDGVRLYICIPSGATYTVYANTAADINTFAKFGSTGTAEAIRHICYYGGVLIGSTLSRAGVINKDTGVFAAAASALSTPNFLNETMTTVGLVSAGNSAYWIVSQGAKAFVYALKLDPSANVMTTEQYMEMPDGFVATCAMGYMSRVYIGGYYASATDGVGKGCIYICSDSEVGLLLELGESPENTAVPESIENDNRIFAICSASKDLYFLTNQAIYKWDIDGGGWSHVCDFPGAGSSQLVVVWDPGSLYSWDGQVATVPDAPHYGMPAGYTMTYTGTGTAAWSYLSNQALWSSSSGDKVCIATGSPSGLDALSNTTGTTLQMYFGDSGNGVGSRGYYSSPSLYVPSYIGYIRDGVRQMKWAYCGTTYYGGYTNGRFILYEWNGTAWVYSSSVNAGKCQPQGNDCHAGGCGSLCFHQQHEGRHVSFTDSA
jgi:hypothetical protein